MLYNLYLVAVLFHLHPYMQRILTEKLYNSFIHFFVPLAKTIRMNGKTAGQFNTTALAVNYIYVPFIRGASSCLL